VAASAPGRINLLGEHIDYNGGPVMPFAIERRTAVVAAPAADWRAASVLDGVVVPFDPAGPPTGTWSDWPRAVARVMLRGGLTVPGAHLAVASSIPVGAGLSSSAALCLSIAKALALMSGHRLPGEALIEVAWQAEHDEVGVPCGRMDQTASALGARGSALLFETGSGTVTTVPLTERIWVFETGVEHRLADGEYAIRRRECNEALMLLGDGGFRVTALADLPMDTMPQWLRLLPPPLDRRVRHVVSETERTRAAAKALAARDHATLGRLMLEGHRSLRDDYQSSCAEADLLVDMIMERGGVGARLTGAGWGGAVIALLPEAASARIAAEVSDGYRIATGKVGLSAWSTRAAGGVRREQVP
jgi:galactokinase